MTKFSFFIGLGLIASSSGFANSAGRSERDCASWAKSRTSYLQKHLPFGYSNDYRLQETLRVNFDSYIKLPVNRDPKMYQQFPTMVPGPGLNAGLLISRTNPKQLGLIAVRNRFSLGSGPNDFHEEMSAQAIVKTYSNGWVKTEANLWVFIPTSLGLRVVKANSRQVEPDGGCDPYAH